MIYKNLGWNIHFLSWGFGFIFLAVGGIQQYITPIYENASIENFGYLVLMLVYCSATLGSFTAPIFLTRFGPKKCMIISSLAYFLFAFVNYIGNYTLILAGAVVIGLSGRSVRHRGRPSGRGAAYSN